MRENRKGAEWVVRKEGWGHGFGGATRGLRAATGRTGEKRGFFRRDALSYKFGPIQYSLRVSERALNDVGCRPVFL